MSRLALNRDFALTWAAEVQAFWLLQTQYENFGATAITVLHANLSSDNKVKKLNSENLANRLRPMAQGIGLTQ